VPRLILAVVAALFAALLAVVAAPASAAAEPYARAAAVPERWDELSRDTAAAWPSEQDSNGRYRDYTDQFYTSEYAYTRYGDAMLGYALIQTGIRDSEPSLVASGLRGIGWVIKRPKNFHKRGSVFEYMAMASAYNLARAELGDDPDFRALRSGWESWLRTLRPISTIYRRPQTSRYSNHYLIEAIAVLELLRSGLSSSRPGAILGGKRGQMRSLTLRLLNSDIPRMDSADTVRVRGQRTFVFSDPPDQPLAYHGFSAGFYARALDLLGRDASGAALRTLRDVVNASVELTAPDGDNSYFGRGQEDLWSLSASALGAEAAAKLPGSGASRDARFHAVTERSLTRLETAYGNGPSGTWVTPAFRESVRGGVRGTDASTGAPSFAGVALVTLNWALEDMADADARPVGRLGADGDGTVQLSLRRARFAVVRRGSLWYAVRRTGSTRAAKDLRNDFGLVALKMRGSNGEWEDVLRLRPRTASRADSAGPVLRSGGGPFFPEGRTISATRAGVVTIGGGFRTAGGRIVRRGGRFVFRPVGCGVKLTWKAARGDRFEYSVFFKSRPEVSGRSVSDGAQKATLSDDATVAVESGYASGTDAGLFRARMRFGASDGSPMSVTVCAE
jgi:hypothetical protein